MHFLSPYLYAPYTYLLQRKVFGLQLKISTSKFYNNENIFNIVIFLVTVISIVSCFRDNSWLIVCDDIDETYAQYR